MTDIFNTTLHTNTGLLVSAFGDSGAAHFSPITSRATKTFILDPGSVDALIDALTKIRDAKDTKTHKHATTGEPIHVRHGNPS